MADPKTDSKRHLTFLLTLWLAVVGGAAGVTACYGHNCDGSTQLYGRNPGEGHMVTPDTWESNAVDADWLPYSRQRLWFFEIPEMGDRKLFSVTPYISADPNPFGPDNGNMTIGSGNLAEQSGYANGRFAIKNNTCADYYVRVVAVFLPAGGATPVPTAAPDAGDAGEEPDAGDADATP